MTKAYWFTFAIPVAVLTGASHFPTVMETPFLFAVDHSVDRINNNHAQNKY